MKEQFHEMTKEWPSLEERKKGYYLAWLRPRVEREEMISSHFETGDEDRTKGEKRGDKRNEISSKS